MTRITRIESMKSASSAAIRSLEVVLQRELHNTRIGRRTHDSSERIARQRKRRGREVRLVDQVECFSPDLQLPILANGEDPRNAQVHLGCTREQNRRRA